MCYLLYRDCVCYLFAEVWLTDELRDEVETDVHGGNARYGGWQQGTRVALQAQHTQDGQEITYKYNTASEEAD